MTVRGSWVRRCGVSLATASFSMVFIGCVCGAGGGGVVVWQAAKSMAGKTIRLIAVSGRTRIVCARCAVREASAIVDCSPAEVSALIIECTNCRARYQYDEDRFERKPSKKIKCAKCGTVFEIHNPAFASPRAAETGDRTYAKPPQKDTTTESQIPTRDESEKPRSTGQVPGGPQMPQGKRLSLAVINGSDAGNVYRIEKPRIIIGRSGSDL